MVIGCGQKDKVYQQRVWFLRGWGNRVWSDCSKDTDKGCGSWDRVIGMKGTGKGCGSSRDVVIGCGQKDKVYQQRVWFLRGWGNRVWSDCSKDTDKGCGSWDRVIGMKGTGKGCGSSRDVVIGCGQKDKVYQQRVWFLWEWGNRV